MSFLSYFPENLIFFAKYIAANQSIVVNREIKLEQLKACLKYHKYCESFEFWFFLQKLLINQLYITDVLIKWILSCRCLTGTSRRWSCNICDVKKLIFTCDNYVTQELYDLLLKSTQFLHNTLQAKVDRNYATSEYRQYYNRIHVIVIIRNERSLVYIFSKIKVKGENCLGEIYIRCLTAKKKELLWRLCG